MNEKISHEITFRVRYHEVDQMGFLHHSRYFIYFEIGRTEFLRTSGFTYKEFEEKGLFLVIANVSCKYKYPIRYDDQIRLITTLTKMSIGKIEHSYEIWDESKNRLHAIGESTLACVDSTGHLHKIPEFLINLKYPDLSAPDRN